MPRPTSVPIIFEVYSLSTLILGTKSVRTLQNERLTVKIWAVQPLYGHFRTSQPKYQPLLPIFYLFLLPVTVISLGNGHYRGKMCHEPVTLHINHLLQGPSHHSLVSKGTSYWLKTSFSHLYAVLFLPLLTQNLPSKS